VGIEAIRVVVAARHRRPARHRALGGSGDLLRALAGLAVFAGLGAWRPLGIAAAAVSLVTTSLFWDPKMAIGTAVDLGVLVALVWTR